MADPILLPDCPELRARAEVIARARYDREVVAMGSNEAIHTTPAWYQRGLTEAALAELRDLSPKNPTARDHACRWLWALLTGEEPEWCPVWQRKTALYRLVYDDSVRIAIVTPSSAEVLDVLAWDGPVLAVPGIATLPPAEALAAAITAALDWRRGQP